MGQAGGREEGEGGEGIRRRIEGERKESEMESWGGNQGERGRRESLGERGRRGEEWE